VRDQGRFEVGPLGLLELLELLAHRIDDEARARIEFSADQSRWFSFATLHRAMAMDFETRPEHARVARWARTVNTEGVLRFFVELSELMPTGRAIVFHQGYAVDRFTEIHLVRGSPVHVSTIDFGFELILDLIASRLLPPERIEESLHSCMTMRVPLGEVLLETAGLDLLKHRARLMSISLERLLRLHRPDFAFSDAAPFSMSPLAPSLVAMIPRLVDRAFEASELRAEVRRSSARRLVLDHARIPPELGFTREQLSVVASAPSLEEGLASIYSDEKLQLVMSYVLRSLDLSQSTKRVPARAPTSR
jgi:hypothetical protein